MKESQALLRLQEVDIRLMRLDAKLKAMPQQKKLLALAEAKRKLKGQITRIVGQRKDAESDVAKLEESHEIILKRIDEVKAEGAERAAEYRGVQDLEAHLSALAKRLEKCEYNYGKAVDELDRLKKAEKNARDIDARLDEQKEVLDSSFKKDSADLMAEVRQLASERKTCLADLSDATQAAYEKASRRFGGLAVERLHGNVPSVCNVKLQPSQYSDLKGGPSITECPYCHRILVTDGMLADQDQQ